MLILYNVSNVDEQEGQHEEACSKFTTAMQVLGYQPGRKA